MTNERYISDFLSKHYEDIWVAEWHLTPDGKIETNIEYLPRAAELSIRAAIKKQQPRYNLIGIAGSQEEARELIQQFTKRLPKAEVIPIKDT